MRTYEEAHDPIPPGAADDEPNDAPVPVCPRCGVLMRRRGADLYCDRHGFEPPRWEAREAQA